MYVLYNAKLIIFMVFSLYEAFFHFIFSNSASVPSWAFGTSITATRSYLGTMDVFYQNHVVQFTNGRAGTSCISYKNRMLVFGGVVDQELHHHKVDSIFYNDLMAMDIDRRKWFPLRIKDKSGSEHGGNRQRQYNKDTDKDVAFFLLLDLVVF